MPDPTTSFSNLAGRLERRTTDPTNPVAGDEYLNTTSINSTTIQGYLRYDGLNWRGFRISQQTSTSTTTTTTSTTTTSTSTTSTTSSTSTTSTTSSTSTTTSTTTSTSSSTSTT